MSMITDWILNIIIFLLFAMVVDMLLPSSNLKKYVKVIMGILLISMIISPLFKLLSYDFEDILASSMFHMEKQEDSIGSLIEIKKKEIQASQHAYTLEQMAVQMKIEVEKELMEKYEVEVEHIRIIAKADIEPTSDQFQQVTVTVKRAEFDKIAAVQPVVIRVEDEQNLSDDTNQRIKTYLSDSWGLPESIIEIVSREES